MSISHTPGPWVIKTNIRTGAHTIGPEGLPFSAATTAGCIGGEQARANARLIAAAPDLLWHCVQMLAVLEARGAGGCVMDGARRVIAKAKGES